MLDVVERIKIFNADRLPDMLKLKYKAMQTDAFVFFRGTCHLFYQDWPFDSALNQAPAAWICGDLHLENFGSYRGDNGLVYFDMNDFDEAALAPCTWEIARCLTSILVAVHTLAVKPAEALKLCNNFLDSYTTTLAQGHIGMVETATATGLIKDLLTNVEQRRRKDFLDARTEPPDKHPGKRRLRIDNHHTLPIDKSERHHVIDLINAWAKSQPKPEFYTVLDVARRIAGTGSLGVKRYMLLVEGNGSPDHNYLLDLKQELPSALQPYLALHQPQWRSEAERCTTIQVRMQATPPALLSNLELEGASLRLKELQPREDRVALNQSGGKLQRLEQLIATLGQIVAWAELRSSGRQGSATADDMIAFGQNIGWHAPLLEYVEAYAQRVETDFATFSAAYKDGRLND
ncbi:MAG: DUF2252 domain-containing protein [Aggregatilineales bacterium]